MGLPTTTLGETLKGQIQHDIAVAQCLCAMSAYEVNQNQNREWRELFSFIFLFHSVMQFLFTVLSNCVEKFDA